MPNRNGGLCALRGSRPRARGGGGRRTAGWTARRSAARETAWEPPTHPSDTTRIGGWAARRGAAGELLLLGWHLAEVSRPAWPPAGESWKDKRWRRRRWPGRKGLQAGIVELQEPLVPFAVPQRARPPMLAEADVDAEEVPRVWLRERAQLAPEGHEVVPDVDGAAPRGPVRPPAPQKPRHSDIFGDAGDCHTRAIAPLHVLHPGRVVAPKRHQPRGH
mmetsp:Transcript_78388/g.243061  ORF Transcript_78388/g.243061 Transcript_78388/m.243061 type:complete len:218 (+) Transcript_78388:618-1271(+)